MLFCLTGWQRCQGQSSMYAPSMATGLFVLHSAADSRTWPPALLHVPAQLCYNPVWFFKCRHADSGHAFRVTEAEPSIKTFMEKRLDYKTRSIIYVQVRVIHLGALMCLSTSPGIHSLLRLGATHCCAQAPLIAESGCHLLLRARDKVAADDWCILLLHHTLKLHGTACQCDSCLLVSDSWPRCVVLRHAVCCCGPLRRTVHICAMQSQSWHMGDKGSDVTVKLLSVSHLHAHPVLLLEH